MEKLWKKLVLLLFLCAALAWGLAWGRKQSAALARASAAILEAQAQAGRDSVALLRADSVVAAARELERRTAAALEILGGQIASSRAEADRLRRLDSLARLNTPPDSSALALPFWKATAARQDTEIVALRSEADGLRERYRLASISWAARAEADSIRWQSEAALSETRRRLAEAALAAAGGKECRIALIGPCPSRTAVALISIVATALVLKL